MRSNIRRILLILIIIVIAGVGVYMYQNAQASSKDLRLSGTVEATEIRLASQVGGRVKEIYAAEGDHVQTGENLIAVYSATGSMNETITSPIDGTVLERLIEPGELATPGSTLMVVADLNTLTLTVYVPENLYGQVQLGTSYPVSVDSFPSQTFQATVTHIADQAEFTPRNVQTIDGRESTVFAIKLSLAPSAGKLKPGMPADVNFSVQ